MLRRGASEVDKGTLTAVTKTDEAKGKTVGHVEDSEKAWQREIRE